VTLIEEQSTEQAPDPDLPPQPRRYPSTIGGALYICVLATMVVGLVLIYSAADWRVGVRVLAGALAAAAVFRLVLPQRDAGMLAVRRRAIDVVLVGSVSIALFVLVQSIPDVG
jgi:hypothetical protein